MPPKGLGRTDPQVSDVRPCHDSAQRANQGITTYQSQDIREKQNICSVNSGSRHCLEHDGISSAIHPLNTGSEEHDDMFPVDGEMPDNAIDFEPEQMPPL